MAAASAGRLREKLVDDVAVHIGQSSLDAVVVVGELSVIDPQEVQCGGMEVVAERGSDGGEAEVVTGAVGSPALDATASQPDPSGLLPDPTTRWRTSSKMVAPLPRPRRPRNMRRFSRNLERW